MNALKTKRSILLAILSISFSGIMQGQEVLTELKGNPTVAKHYSLSKTSALKSKLSVLDTVALPFIDGFSKDDIYPDAALWTDSSVYVNRTYPIQPPTLGAATFDGVSKSGCPYDTTLTTNGASLPADTLTSKPINLALPPSDSVVLSFYWQAEGRGNDPEAGDTLLLDFFNSVAGTWSTVWYTKGYNPTIADTAFRLVMISITNPNYLQPAFRFRFRNKATVNGNVDHWHIDYVVLDKNRPMNDTVFNDVAFAYPAPSLLKNYSAMPWKQYMASEMKSNFNLFIRNNDTVAAGKNTSFGYKIYDNTGSTVANYSAGSDNILPYHTTGYHNNPLMNAPQVGTNVPGPTLTPYSYPALSDSASFLVECVINTAPDLDRQNDTLRFKQIFHNYYAYDDGSVEAGYGLNVYGGQMAYKFSLNVADTLTAVQMLFNWMPPKVSQRQFKIRIWNDAGGIPGSIIYEDTLVSPKYNFQFHSTWGNLINEYYTYVLKTTVPLSGTFYVGFIQYCCNGNNELINIGYDKNSDASSKMFYNTGSSWSQTALAQKGAWMIRPFFGDTAGVAGVGENITNSFKVYPNPNKGNFVILSPQSAVSNLYSLKVYNLFGNLIHEQALESKDQPIHLDAPNGVYLLRITDERGAVYSHTVVISR